MYQHVRERQFYEDIYDKHSVEWARTNQASFEDFRRKWFEIMPEEKTDSFRSVFYLNWIYMLMAGSELVERYDRREARISQMISEDEAKDAQIAQARLTKEPTCQHCHKTGLRISDKTLLTRNGYGTPEEVLFMLKCPHCEMNSAVWEDGRAFEHRVTPCPKCKSALDEKDIRKGKIITTKFNCPSCGHSHQDKFDFSSDEGEIDQYLESDKEIYCLRDPKMLEQFRDAKRRLEGLVEMGRKYKEKDDNKDLYEAVEKLEKLKVAELSTLLSPALEAAGYIEFSLEKPEIGKNFTVRFSCLDNVTGRADYESEKLLKKTLKSSLAPTNWRLSSDGISYRLGYLTGQVRAYEREEELVQLVTKENIIKPKS